MRRYAVGLMAIAGPALGCVALPTGGPTALTFVVPSSAPATSGAPVAATAPTSSAPLRPAPIAATPIALSAADATNFKGTWMGSGNSGNVVVQGAGDCAYEVVMRLDRFELRVDDEGRIKSGVVSASMGEKLPATCAFEPIGTAAQTFSLAKGQVLDTTLALDFRGLTLVEEDGPTVNAIFDGKIDGQGRISGIFTFMGMAIRARPAWEIKTVVSLQRTDAAPSTAPSP